MEALYSFFRIFDREREDNLEVSNKFLRLKMIEMNVLAVSIFIFCHFILSFEVSLNSNQVSTKVNYSIAISIT